MKRFSSRILIGTGLVMVVALVAWQNIRRHFRIRYDFTAPYPITIDYPAEGSISPP